MAADQPDQQDEHDTTDAERVEGVEDVDDNDLVDREKFDVDPSEGHLSGTAFDGSSEIPGASSGKDSDDGDGDGDEK